MKISNRLKNLEDFGSFFAIGVPTAAIATGYGVIATALSILSLGQCKSFNDGTRYTKYAGCVIPGTLERALRVINPKAKFKGKSKRQVVQLGYLTERAALPIFKQARKFSQCEGSFIKRHIFSRLTHAAYPLTATVTRVADFGFGLLVSFFSLLTFGTYSKVNGIALRQLSIFSIVDDVCLGVRGLINPHQQPELRLEGISNPPDEVLRYCYDSEKSGQYTYLTRKFQKRVNVVPQGKIEGYEIPSYDEFNQKVDGKNKLFFWDLTRGRLPTQLINLRENVSRNSSVFNKFVERHLGPEKKDKCRLCLIGVPQGLEVVKRSDNFKAIAPHFSSPYYYMSNYSSDEPHIEEFTLES